MIRTLPRAVIFDWDHTLVDNFGCIIAALNAALTGFGHPPWTDAEARLRIRQSLRDSFPALFGEDWRRARDIFYDHFRAHHLDHLVPMTGAAAVLDRLCRRGVVLGVVSNKNGEFLRAECARLGWTGCFTRLVGATDALEDKPSPAPVRLVLEATLIPPGPEVWFVGDTAIDMECAHAAGCVPVLVGETPDDLSQFPPAHRLKYSAMLCDLGDGLPDPISV